MSQPKRYQLKDTEVSLLTYAAAENIQDMLDDGSYIDSRSLGFKVWDKVHDHELQVHVIVTRDEREFMEPFQTDVTE
jgi:hypothetical protein